MKGHWQTCVSFDSGVQLCRSDYILLQLTPEQVCNDLLNEYQYALENNSQLQKVYNISRLLLLSIFVTSTFPASIDAGRKKPAADIWLSRTANDRYKGQSCYYYQRSDRFWKNHSGKA